MISIIVFKITQTGLTGQCTRGSKQVFFLVFLFITQKADYKRNTIG